MAGIAEIATYKNMLVFLGTAGVVVPLVHRINISPVFGYLAAGALLGPYGLGGKAHLMPGLGWFTIEHQREIAGIADLGVVFLLFLIGLELSVQRLMTMRRLVFGLGSLQVVLSATLIGLVAYWLGVGPRGALLIGLSLALSSTAMVIEVLSSRRRLSTNAGRTSFSVLLFQDLAVVPILFLVGILAAEKSGSIVTGMTLALLQAGGTILVIVGVGWVILRPLFRMVVGTESAELFMAATLFIVIGTAVGAAAAGLSMALGAFVAGLLLAETEYRKSIEATIEPFKGLLVGLLFFSIGMQIDVGAVMKNPLSYFLAATAYVGFKVAIMYVLARLFGVSHVAALESSLLLGPGGEFAFIVVSIAMVEGIFAYTIGAPVLAIVSFSMVFIPILGAIGARISLRSDQGGARDPRLLAAPSGDPSPQALVFGFGRVGQLTSEMLQVHGVSHLVVDSNPDVVTHARLQGHDVYFGDGTNPLFLRACGIGTASAVIITVSGRADIDAMVDTVRSIRPDIVVVARARDAAHARHLYGLKVTDAVPETIEASLQLSEAALVGLGIPVGPVIASIHDKRDQFRRELQHASGGTAEQRGIKSPKTEGV